VPGRPPSHRRWPKAAPEPPAPPTVPSSRAAQAVVSVEPKVRSPLARSPPASVSVLERTVAHASASGSEARQSVALVGSRPLPAWQPFASPGSLSDRRAMRRCRLAPGLARRRSLGSRHRVASQNHRSSFAPP
jgi:hypothetical protein